MRVVCECLLIYLFVYILFFFVFFFLFFMFFGSWFANRELRSRPSSFCNVEITVCGTQ